MKKNWVILFCFFLPALASAQSDSLIIRFKNGKQVTISLSDIQKITFDTVTSSVAQPNNTVRGLELSPSFPNPTTRKATIDFTLSSAGNVTIAIYDSKGILIRRFVAANSSMGKNSITWDGLGDSGAKVPSGAYFYEVNFKDEIQVRQMVIIK